MKGYNSLEEFKPDHELMRAYQNDGHLLASIQKKVNNSSEDIRKQIDNYLCNFLLEDNPFYVFNRIVNENPECFLILKSQEDPWFKV